MNDSRATFSPVFDAMANALADAPASGLLALLLLRR